MAKELKTARFIFSAEPSLLAKIDKWRAKQPGVPPRAEAVRRLLGAALAMNNIDKWLESENIV